DLQRLPAPLSSDHDDDDGGAARHVADRPRDRRRRRRASSARAGRRGRVARVAAVDALHHAGAVPLYGVGAEVPRHAPDLACVLLAPPGAAAWLKWRAPTWPPIPPSARRAPSESGRSSVTRARCTRDGSFGLLPRGLAVAARPHAVVDRVTVDGEEGGAARAGGVERGARAGRGLGAFLLAIDARLLVDRRVSRRCAAADQDRTQDQGRDDSHV